MNTNEAGTFLCYHAEENGGSKCETQCNACIQLEDIYKKDVAEVEQLIKEYVHFDTTKGLTGAHNAAELIYNKLKARFILNNTNKR